MAALTRPQIAQIVNALTASPDFLADFGARMPPIAVRALVSQDEKDNFRAHLLSDREFLDTVRSAASNGGLPDPDGQDITEVATALVDHRMFQMAIRSIATPPPTPRRRSPIPVPRSVPDADETDEDDDELVDDRPATPVRSARRRTPAERPARTERRSAEIVSTVDPIGGVQPTTGKERLLQGLLMAALLILVGLTVGVVTHYWSAPDTATVAVAPVAPASGTSTPLAPTPAPPVATPTLSSKPLCDAVLMDCMMRHMGEPDDEITQVCRNPVAADRVALNCQ